MSVSKVADYKAVGGKLVRVRLVERNGKIVSIRISGDFFLVPEESLSLLEKMLEGLPLQEADVRKKICQFFENSVAESLGLSQADLVQALLSATEEMTTT